MFQHLRSPAPPNGECQRLPYNAECVVYRLPPVLPLNGRRRPAFAALIPFNGLPQDVEMSTYATNPCVAHRVTTPASHSKMPRVIIRHAYVVGGV